MKIMHGRSIHCGQRAQGDVAPPHCRDLCESQRRRNASISRSLQPIQRPSLTDTPGRTGPHPQPSALCREMEESVSGGDLCFGNLWWVKVKAAQKGRDRGGFGAKRPNNKKGKREGLHRVGSTVQREGIERAQRNHQPRGGSGKGERENRKRVSAPLLV